MKKDNFDCLAKLLIIGDSGVGKTNILLRFCENSLNINKKKNHSFSQNTLLFLPAATSHYKRLSQNKKGTSTFKEKGIKI